MSDPGPNPVSTLTLCFSLLTGFNARRDQTDIVDARLMAEVDNLCHILEVEVLIPLDVIIFLMRFLVDLHQFGFDRSLVEGIFVDLV